MIRKYLLPILAILGALFGLYTVYQSQKTVPTPPIPFPPAKSPYTYSIAASGIIEASSQNISVGCPFNEVIDKIFVKEGDQVKTGDPLFQLDLRNFEAQAVAAQAELNLALVQMENQKTQFSFYQRLKDIKAVSEQIYQQANYTYLQSVENVHVARANLEIALTNIKRAIICAPIDGEILQLNIHVGEIAPVIPYISAQSTWLTAVYGTLILLGTVDPLQIRIDIDEDDAWRYKPGAKATAFVRGNRNIHFPIAYFRTEPYIIPKRSFTGDTVERVDTRVLQTLYTFNKENLPIYTGQVVDIFIEAEPIEMHGNQ